MKYYPTKEEAADWSGGYHDIKYEPEKGYHLVVNKRAYNAHIKKIDDNIKRMQKDHKNEVRWDRRHGIINNHLCCGCDRIIGNGRQICTACIDDGLKRVLSKNKDAQHEKRTS